MDREKRKGMAWAEGLIVLQSVIYGFGDPISKIAFDIVPVYTMMTVRYFIAFAVCFALFHRRIADAVKNVPLGAWLIPGICIGLSYILNNVALALTDATSVAFLRSLSIVITPAFAFIAYRTHYRWQHLLIQVMALPGMYLLCVRGGLTGFGAGELVSICAAVLMAGALVFSKRFLDVVDPVSMTGLQAGCSAVMAAAGGFIFEGGLHPLISSVQAWLIILYLAVMCTFLGYLMQNLALTRISDREVALVQSLCPVMTAFFAYIMLGEKLSPAGIAGAAIIIVCISASTLVKPGSGERD